MRVRLIGGSAILTVAMVLATPAIAQQTETETPAAPADPQAQPQAGRTVYQADYFRAFSPANALEIVRRVPGFNLDVGAQEVRGFGGAAGNVVINGARPSAKSDTLETILARIPARRVLRVEVASGEQFGAEFAGRAQVLNLVLDAQSGLSGTIDVSMRRDFSGQLTPQGTVSALMRRGPSTFNLSAGYNNRHAPDLGTDTITALPSGTLIEYREKYNDVSDRLLFVSGSWALEEGENRSAHLNGRFASGDFILPQTNDVFPVGRPVRDDRLLQDFHRAEYEMGGDIERPLMGGGIKLVGLATRRNRDNLEESVNRIRGEVIGGFSQHVVDRRDEAVLRLVWSRSDWNGWTVETGLEGAFNQLVSDVRLFELTSSGTRNRIDLPIDQATVTEYRGEAFVNAGRSLSPNFRIDGGLTFEASRLTVTGDTESERELLFLKPRLVLDWRPGGGWRTQLSIARTVAQLDFLDFISAAELSNDRVTGGNADLRPQRAWELLATIERPILGDGQLRVELGYQHIQQVQDRVPTPEGFDAPGNLGNGRHAFVRGTLDAPLGRFGIRGGRLTLNGTIRDTSVVDPYTNRPRAFSGFAEWELQGTFRQDLGRFAWGIQYFGSPARAFFRRDEIDLLNGQEPFADIFVDYRLNPRTTFTLRLENFADVDVVRRRTFYSPDRSNPAPSRLEIRQRSGHPAISLRLRHSFE